MQNLIETKEPMESTEHATMHTKNHSCTLYTSHIGHRMLSS